jgi:hypothetical protein
MRRVDDYLLETTPICRKIARIRVETTKFDIKLFAIAYRTGCRYSTVLALEMFCRADKCAA